MGRSDGTISCDLGFCGQNYIVRVQPAFPGMPQMPTGPGAPSDAGPDDSLVDPAMIGPDGAPVDGGAPPDGEDGDGGAPFGDDDGGEDGDGPPPPRKKPRKESARRYRGLEGQLLTEDQLVRHVAVRASWADPRVMALLRRESARGRRPFGKRVTTAGGPGDVAPGDAISQAEQLGRLRAMREHFRGLGFPVRDADENGYENAGPVFTVPDTGHSVSVGHSRRDQTWHASIAHPGDPLPSGQKTVASVNLGTNAGHVPHLLVREMGSEPLTGEMRRQWQRAHLAPDYGPRPRGGWRNPDGSRLYPDTVHFTARGATLPHDEDEDDGGEGY